MHRQICRHGLRTFLPLVLMVVLGVPFIAIAVFAQPFPEQGYRLGPNDVIRIQVFGEEDLTVEGKVAGDGKINFPLLGALEVGGRTVQELREELTVKLAGGYVRQPKVTVHITRYRNFYVSGEVKTPGGYSYEEGLTIQKAISLAGGFTEKSDRGAVKVVRESRGIAEAVPAEPGALVFPDDTIVVAQIKKFYVTGEVGRPGGYSYEDGLTVHKAISIAGGLTEKAERREIKLTRVAGGVADIIPGDQETHVLPDDIIVIEPQTHKFYASGEVKTPGGYPYKDGLTVHKAIAMAGGLTEKAERSEFRVLRHANGHEETLVVKLETLVLPDDIIVVAEGQRFYISGEVKTPGRYLYEKGLTIHKAISMAGGVTEKAELSSIKVTRLNETGADTLSVSPDALVVPDDIIAVEAQTHKFYVSGEVKNPGGYAYKYGLNIQKAIAMAGGPTDKADRGNLRAVRIVNGEEKTLPVTLNTPLLAEDTIVVAEGQRFYVSGEIKTPGSYLYEKDLTIQKALSIAGGVTEKAERRETKVTRVAGGLVELIPGNPELPVLPDDIIVVEPQTHKFYASGEVKTPGGYPYKDGLTVHKAIAMAGGLTEKAERNEFRVLRRVNGREETLPGELENLVLPDDIIVVPEGQRFYVSGEVKTPGRYLHEKGLTIHKAISIAGGATEKAERRNIKVTRWMASGIAETMAVDPNSQVQPDDFIVVERMQKIYVNGEVKKPGDYAYEKGITVHKIITMAGGFTDKAAEGRTRVLRVVEGQEQSVRVKLEDLVFPEDIIVVPKRFF